MSDLFVNKIFAAGLTTGLALLGLNAAGDTFFSTKKADQPGYFVEVASSDDGGSDEPAWIPPTDYGVLLAAADVAKGERKAAACIACHTFDDGGGIKQGPNLYDIVMSGKASSSAFSYSEVLTTMGAEGGKWDYAALDGFLKDPKGYAKGTAMNYPGLGKEADRMNVIAYLRTLSASPAPLPEPLPPEALLPPATDEAVEEAAIDGDETSAELIDAAVGDADAVIEAAAEEATEVVEAAAVETVGQPVADTAFEVGGVEIMAAASGVEAGLIAFIESDREPCTDRECWYTFDRLTFESGSSNLDMTRSSAQLDNIARIMEAYPGIQLKLGGYTDNIGSLNSNMALSEDRAQTVKTALEGLGVASERLVAEGYGPDFPVATNDTEEGRAQNRRIDVRVRRR